jgi:hypothetical protein
MFDGDPKGKSRPMTPLYIYIWLIGTLSRRMSLNATSIVLKQSKT